VALQDRPQPDEGLPFPSFISRQIVEVAGRDLPVLTSLPMSPEGLLLHRLVEVDFHVSRSQSPCAESDAEEEIEGEREGERGEDAVATEAEAPSTATRVRTPTVSDGTSTRGTSDTVDAPTSVEAEASDAPDAPPAKRGAQ
ncbi:hypothetical protein KIPB_011719, partial [Kipferlia bialata]